MKQFDCPLNKNGCKYGGNKAYSYGFSSGTASYCRKVKKFVCDLEEKCPLEEENKFTK